MPRSFGPRPPIECYGPVPSRSPISAVFSFLYFLKIKISKIYPGRPPIGRQVQSVIFFLQIRNVVPGEKKGPVARWGGDSPPFFSGTYFELFERVFVIIVGKISAANSYRT